MSDIISFEEFSKLDLRVGKILTAERIEGADKLLKLTINLGEEKPRMICSGVAQFYIPEELIGKSVVVIANLVPRIMRGIESQGMVLMAIKKDPETGIEKPILLCPTEDVFPGSIVR